MLSEFNADTPVIGGIKAKLEKAEQGHVLEYH
jgi:hypothetical protein